MSAPTAASSAMCVELDLSDHCPDCGASRDEECDRECGSPASIAPVIRQLRDLAAEVPAVHMGTAWSIRLWSSALSYRRETPAEAAEALRNHACQSREHALTHDHVAGLFVQRAEFLERAAAILEPAAKGGA